MIWGLEDTMSPFFYPNTSTGENATVRPPLHGSRRKAGIYLKMQHFHALQGSNFRVCRAPAAQIWTCKRGTICARLCVQLHPEALSCALVLIVGADVLRLDARPAAAAAFLSFPPQCLS